MTAPRRHQIKAFVTLEVHEKFRLWSEERKRSMQRAAEDLIESAVKEVVLPPFPTPRETPQPVRVDTRTPEQIEAERQRIAKLAEEYDPPGEFMRWIGKGSTIERACGYVREACGRFGIAWAGPTAEMQERAAIIIARKAAEAERPQEEEQSDE